MGADATHIFYGVRYHVSDPAEIKLLENESHMLVKAAKKAGLQTYWRNCDFDGGEFYLLYVGRKISTLGLEGEGDLELSDTEFAQIQLDTRKRLRQGGFSLVPA